MTLIEQLEASEEGSVRLNSEITVAIGKADHIARVVLENGPDSYIPTTAGGQWVDDVPYTTDLTTARNLSNWLLLYASDIGADGLAMVTLADPSTSPVKEVTGIHGRLVMAWVIAAMKAREADDIKG